ncbi:organic cation/carnitine transporter 3-like [Prunus avium]|uniref:Organic cation/carnitine transporter 3-like n=1 Tax=Prunus avium TaxID=42229 RepID=A0A6P5SX94_PRUAV|nr:organic cation/carnitine transporter 3-like [Prunus avium]
MADPTPLLPHSTSSDLISTPPISLDSVIERVTANSAWPQLLQAFLVSLSWFFDGQQTFITVYTDAEPTWHCTEHPNTTCRPTSNICDLSTSTWAWDKPSYTTIISDFNLQCATPLISCLPASSFFFGCLLGGFVLATLADSSLGRRNLLFLSCFTMCVASLITAFSTNVIVYAAWRFVSGFGRASVGACALVLSTEIVSRKLRGRIGIAGFLCFSFGFLSLPGIAYVNRYSSWRTLYVWTSVPGISYSVLVFFFASESPKWLFTRGRKDEAVATLGRLGHNNNSSLNLYLSGIPLLEESQEVNLFSSLKILFEKKWAFRRTLALMVVGFGIGMVYYGMPLRVGNLGFNIYLSLTFNALSEIPSFALVFFFIGKWNRKSSLLTFMMISGVCSIMCVVVSSKWKALQIGLEIVSFFSANTAFSIIMVYTLELFPTCVRNSATSMVRQGLVLGGIFSLVISAGRNYNEFLSYGVFGVVIICCGVLVLSLPETKGLALCDTMDEQERKEVADSINTIMLN